MLHLGLITLRSELTGDWWRGGPDLELGAYVYDRVSVTMIPTGGGNGLLCTKKVK